MKKEELFGILSKVDDDLLAATEAPRKKYRSWQKLSAIAACFLLIIVVQNYSDNHLKGEPEEAAIYNIESDPDIEYKDNASESADNSSKSDLHSTGEAAKGANPTPEAVMGVPRALSDDPSLLTVNNIFSDGMGFSAIFHPNLTQQDLPIPWKVTDHLDKMPVYRNPYHKGASGFSKITKEELQSTIKRVEKALGTEMDRYEESRYGGKLASLHGISEQILIDAYSNDHYLISFQQGFMLPKGYTVSIDGKNNQKILDGTKYLTKKYAALSSFTTPEYVIYDEYNVYGDLTKSNFVYEGSGDLSDRIVHYYLNRISFFSFEKDGKLSMITRSNYMPDLEFVGDYPVIRLDEAKKQLQSGQFITSVPSEFKLGEIAAVELCYIDSDFIEYQIPYYLFYVKLLDENGIPIQGGPNLNSYGYFYVPAVTEEFLNIYDGKFN